MNLLLLQPEELNADGTVVISDKRAHRLLTSVGIEVGMGLRVGLVHGPLGTAQVQQIAGSSVHLLCAFEKHPPAQSKLDLILALPRPQCLRHLLPQLSALGVGKIILTNAKNVQPDYFGSHLLRSDQWLPLLMEGLEQGCHTHLPTLTIRRRIRPFIEEEIDRLFPEHRRLLADPGGPPLRPLSKDDVASSVLLAVGAERGWNDFERALFAARGFQTLGLGSRMLRTDTACVGLISVLKAQYGLE